MPLETTPESPVPVRTVLRLVGERIGRLGRVWVEGQIAELSRRGGTAYLTLHDPLAAVSVRVVCPVVVFEAADPPPAEGARVIVWAKPDFNTSRGAFSLTAIQIRAVGTGDLLARLDRLRRALAAEGLFAPERKRPLPFLPGVIGLICGRDSAAELDVLRNAARRWPAVRFRVEQVAVQGPRAAEEITEALRALDADPAVAACRTPVVSAIGHEQDTPILDHVADVRASTPTDAARRVVPDVAEQLALIAELRSRARRSMTGRVDREMSWLAAVRSRPALASPVLEIDRQQERVAALAERARRTLEARLDRAADEMRHTRSRLLALSPAATLGRGYAIVLRGDGTVIRSAATVADRERLTVRFAADQMDVTALRPASPPARGPAGPWWRERGTGGASRGSGAPR